MFLSLKCYFPIGLWTFCHKLRDDYKYIYIYICNTYLPVTRGILNTDFSASFECLQGDGGNQRSDFPAQRQMHVFVSLQVYG